MDSEAPETPHARTDLPHVVIIGGGFGGLRAARELKGEPVRLTLVDRSNHHLFQPLLYQVAMAGLSAPDIAYPIRSALRNNPNAVTLLGEVVDTNLSERTLTLHDGRVLHYDYLVIAAGARTNYFGHDADWGRFALGLKNVEDALEIRTRVLLAFETAEREPDPEKRRKLLNFVVIGGGPTGVEIAGALRELARAVLARDFRVIDPSQARVVLIEQQDRVLAAGFDADVSERAKRQLEDLGVEVRLKTRVDGIDQRGVHIGSELIEAGTVLWTAGVTARRLTQKLGVKLDRAGRIYVEQDLTLPGHPEVYAIGDNATLIPEGAAHPLPGLAAVAVQQGRHAAASIARSVRREPRTPFVYVDKGIMATIGRSRAVVQAGRTKLSGLIAWLAWLLVHIVLLIGFRNRLMVLLNWAWQYVSYRSGARLIIGWRSWDWTMPTAAHARALAEPQPRPLAPASAEPEPVRPSQIHASPPR
jgi:NADH:ubiquinone reductase (H+-translocating)